MHKEPCDKCLGHELMEEKSKLVESIPELLTFRDNMKGGSAVAAIFVGALITIMFVIISGSSTAQDQKQRSFEATIDSRMLKHEELVAKSTAAQEAQVRELLRAVNRVENTVATFVETQKVTQEQLKQNVNQNQARITEIERVILRRYKGE